MKGELLSVDINFKRARSLSRPALLGEIVRLQKKLKEIDEGLEYGLSWHQRRKWYALELRIYKKIAGISGALLLRPTLPRGGFNG